MERSVRSGVAAASARGLRLVADSTNAGVVYPPRLQLAADVSLAAAAAQILGSCLEHFVSNWPALRESDAPESVHQMRVALRRLRACVGLLRPALRRNALDHAALRAKTIAATLGEARDLDVFRDNLVTRLRKPLEGEASFYALLDAVELRRLRAYEQARATIADPATRQFVSELRAELASMPGAGESAAPSSARKFAESALQRLHKRAQRKCAGLSELSPDARHNARIALKKARYGAEFFASLFDKRGRARAYSRDLGALQDSLGADNDLETATHLLKRIEAEDGAERVAHAAAFVRDLRARAQKRIAARARSDEATLRKMKVFWR
jgi:CHAD domain-containing protein